MSKLSTKDLTLVGLMSALMCILGPMSIPIPFSPVPISLTTFTVILSVLILGLRLGFISYLVYFLIGLVGLPVFSGFSGGFSKVIGPTGGYLIGFFLIIMVTGYVMEKKPNHFIFTVIGITIGLIACYLLGTLWLCFQLDLDFVAGLYAGVIPYIPGDIVKIAFAMMLAPRIKQSLGSSR